MSASPTVVLAVAQWISDTYPTTTVGAYDMHTGRSLTSPNDWSQPGFMEITVHGGLITPLVGLDIVFGRQNARIICWAKDPKSNKDVKILYESVSYHLADPTWITHVENLLDAGVRGIETTL